MSTSRIPGIGRHNSAKSPLYGHNIPQIKAAVGSVGQAAPKARAGDANRCAVEGARLVKQGRPAQAVSWFKRSIDLDPNVAATHHDLGLALLRSGRLEQAQEPFAAAVRLDPGLASAVALLDRLAPAIPTCLPVTSLILFFNIHSKSLKTEDADERPTIDLLQQFLNFRKRSDFLGIPPAGRCERRQTRHMAQPVFRHRFIDRLHSPSMLLQMTLSVSVHLDHHVG